MHGQTAEQINRLLSLPELSLPQAVPDAVAAEQSRDRLRGENPKADTSQVQRSSPDARRIFGHSIFNNRNLSFEPSVNVPTPENYVLGPGDEVIIDVWGASESTVRQNISPEGHIQVRQVGPVYLSGLTVAEAGVKIERAFSRIYSSLDGDYQASYIKLSLGRIRSIRVNVMGEVSVPGTYTVSALSSLFHVLYSAGGINEIGSMRGVKVFRAGKQVADVDIYAYLLEGRSDIDIRLRDGDVVIVPPYAQLVEVTGRVKRPMKYELKPGEPLSKLIEYSGGFAGDAYKKGVRVLRYDDREQKVYNVDRERFGGFLLADGDRIEAGEVLGSFENSVELRGAVWRPGLYAISEQTATVRQLLAKAEGITGDAFTARAQLVRLKPDMTRETLAIDLGALLAGQAADIALRAGDQLYIPSIFDLRENYTVSVHGAVRMPGTFPYSENITLEDAVVMAGGLRESASTVRVEVSRRVKDPAGTQTAEQRSENYFFTLRDGLVADGREGFTLRPFDEVHVRTSPGYQAQQNVYISGEALFAGGYALSKKDERLSDLVGRAGGLSRYAYVQGAQLVRQMTEDELRRYRAALDVTRRSLRDSVGAANLEHATTYAVGIELDRALANPGSDCDLVLREGDRLLIPEYNGTVKVSGGVIYPNTVAYKKGAGAGHYIDQSGGYAYRAFRRKAYVVYMNGTVARVRKAGASIAPGCEIIVPLKPGRGRRSSLAEILGVTNSTTATAALVNSIINMAK